MSDLKITDIEVIPLSYRYKEEERWTCPGWTTLQRNAVLVRIWTNKGICGVGEIGEATHIPLSVIQIVEENFKPMLLGEDPFNVELLWQKMYMRSLPWGRKGATITIISGLEIALWDILGKYLDRPVYDMLGGLCREKIRVYASAGMSKKKEDLIDEVLNYKDQGYTGIKMRIGNADIYADIDSVKEVRNALGRDIDLMVDAGQCYVDCSWNYNTALRVARYLEDCDLYWLEEPFTSDNIEDYARLAEAIDIPIAAGENEYTKYGFKELIANRAVDILQPDATRCGGILESKKIAAIAQAFHMDIAPHIFTSGVSLMANMNIIASTPNVIIMEYDRTLNPLRDELLIEPLKYDNGYVQIPKNLPGLGINLTDDIIKKYSYIPKDVHQKSEFRLMPR